MTVPVQLRLNWSYRWENEDVGIVIVEWNHIRRVSSIEVSYICRVEIGVGNVGDHLFIVL